MAMNEKSHGGKRTGAGRKPATTTGLVRKNVTLDMASIAVFIRIGNGDLSNGMREAAAIIEQHQELFMSNSTFEKVKIQASSKTLRKRTAQLQETFNMDFETPANPSAAFDMTVERLEMLIAEVAQKAYAAGARQGGIDVLEAVRDGKVTLNKKQNMLFFHEPDEPITVSGRLLRGTSRSTESRVQFQVADVELTYQKLGFDE